MPKLLFSLLLLMLSINTIAQKDSLQIGNHYAEDQIYASISFAQFFEQPSVISKSGFSYGISLGFIKDIILNKSGTISIGAGVGYGYDFFDHQLKVEEINNNTVFNNNNTIRNNIFKSHNLEFPLEVRWRTSTAKKYSFWRVYTGVKFLYNISNSFQFNDPNNASFTYKNVSAYEKLQYGLTLSAGYDAFNINIFYGLTPIFKDASINGETIDTKILKLGLIFYIL